ncbi:MAG: YceI family protein [Sedimentisphaerales bacterium]|jgi:hypothetical protein
MLIKTDDTSEIQHSASFRSILTIIVFVSLCQTPLLAEYGVHYEPTPAESHVQIDGTSNLHEWAIKGTVIEGYIDVNETCQFNPKVQGLPGLNKVMASLRTHVEIPIRSLKSGHSGMDKNTYKALKSAQYPKIIYDLGQASIKTRPKPPDVTAEFDTVGKLSIAGVTRPLNMPVSVKPLTNQRVQISGRATMKMTDFGVKPPTALFGLLKTGDQITISFTWTVDRKTPMPHMPRYAIDLDHRQAITGMVLYYLQADGALAKSELAKAKEALAQVQKATEKLSQMQAGQLPEDEKKAWGDDLGDLRAACAEAAKAENLEDVRLAFRRLSRDTITLVSDFGYAPLESDKPLFSYRCSRIDQRASQKVWLQNTPTADSPYEPPAKGQVSCGSLTAIYCPERLSTQSLNK